MDESHKKRGTDIGECGNASCERSRLAPARRSNGTSRCLNSEVVAGSSASRERDRYVRVIAAMIRRRTLLEGGVYRLGGRLTTL